MSGPEARLSVKGWRAFSELAGVLVFAIGGLVTFGWIAGIRPLIHLLPVGVAMNLLTAVDFVCAGLSLWFLAPMPDGRNPRQRQIGRWLALFVVITAALDLANGFARAPLSLDRLLFPHRPPAPAVYNDMAPNSAVSFLFSGVALICMDVRTRRGFRPAEWLMLTTGLLGWLALIGYSYRVLELYRFGGAVPMALDSAIAFTLLSAGFLAARPDAGAMRLVTSATTGGAMIRRLLPITILIPWLLGAVLLLFAKAGYYDSAISLFAIATIAFFSAVAWWNAKLLYVADLERDVAQRRAAAEQKVTRVLAESHDLSEAVPRILQVLGETLWWDAGAMWLVDTATNTARCVEFWSPANAPAPAFAEASRRTVLERGQGLPGCAWAGAEPVYVPDLTEDREFARRQAARESGLRSAYAFPVWLGTQVFGVVELFRRRQATAEDALRDMPVTVPTQVGLFIERTHAEGQLQQASRDLQRSNTELQQFAYVASHDLFEPLRMVTSYLQLVRQKYSPQLEKQALEFLDLALDGARRMDALIHDLLAYSRVDARGRAFEITDCEQVVNSALANLKIAIEETHAAVAHEPLPRVLGDYVQLTQVFQNLIGNALKFHNAAPPKIDIRVSKREQEWLLTVRDNGIGIDPKHFQRIFVIFQRLHSRQEYAGTGMGLAICKKIIERHGGRIWVESVPGKGSSFLFTLPALKDEMG